MNDRGSWTSDLLATCRLHLFRLVRDPELKYTPKGSAVCTFALASNRYFKQDDET